MQTSGMQATAQQGSLFRILLAKKLTTYPRIIGSNP